MIDQWTVISSPIGKLLIAGNDDALVELTFSCKLTASQKRAKGTAIRGAVLATVEQLEAYFAGKLKVFELPLQPVGTEFQKRVWSALLKIPYGETTAYGQLAKILGVPKAARAVGAANGRNPIPIIVPCHRVIGSNGKLTGFGGGLPTKQHLLDLEQSQQPFALRG
ncbi:MAG: methylated-DNA-[protein]-cysteine S-methyltransferase [Pirellulaceae bacterium]|jgi:methylated-DNA-[protein]-cysteine S-methyltransferase